MKTVIKVGTSTLAYPTGRLNIRHMERLCRVISDIKNSGSDIILVSSGAVGMGMGKLALKERPTRLSLKQATAAVGQCELMYTYDKLFSEYNHTVAQILLTADDIKDEGRKTNFTNTVSELLSLGALPIVNENDTVATGELEVAIGDNDTLAAIVAESVGADLFVMLTDIDGLYTADPRLDKDAVLIPEVEHIDAYVEKIAGGAGSGVGTGGMKTKISAAKIATAAGCDTVIVDGSDPYILYDIADGKKVGTRFIGNKK